MRFFFANNFFKPESDILNEGKLWSELSRPRLWRCLFDLIDIKLTKFSIVIAFPRPCMQQYWTEWSTIRKSDWTEWSTIHNGNRTDLSLNRHVICTRSRGWTITGIKFEHFVIGYHVIQKSITSTWMDGFLLNVFYSFENLWKALQTCSIKGGFQKAFLISIFAIDTDCVSHHSGTNRARS